MNTRDLTILIAAIGLVLLIYLIRYIIAKVVYKGADAIENKLRQIEPGTRATGNQSLAERLGVPVQNPQANQIQASQAQGTDPAAGSQAASSVAPKGSFCTKCGAEVKKN